MTSELPNNAQKLEADLVVIGGGGAGLAAALTAAEKGVGRIVVLEKRSAPGGNTARATGLFACESPAQKRQSIVADKDQLFKRATDWAHWGRVNPRIIRAFLNRSGDTIRWLEGKGLEFNVIAFFPNQNPRVEHVPKGRGAELTQILADQCGQAGVQILTRTAARKIRRGSGGAVTGVGAIGTGDLEISTGGVIIASGGFGGNPELMRKYCPLYYYGMPLRGLPLTGDGLLMAIEAGAAAADMVTLLKEGPRVDGNTWPLRGLERDPVTLWVNREGKRFVDEATGSHPFESVNAVLNQPGRVCYTLLDDATRKKAGAYINDLEKLLRGEAERDRVKISDSLEEIAGWIGAEPSVLRATVDEYNGFCARGYDEHFAKDRRYLYPMLQVPFYAARGEPYILDTMGGIQVNERMEVLDGGLRNIPGLYAAGVATSGWESETYCSDLSGSAFGYAINSGRIAGENAAGFALERRR
jgi:fumarate reductase flavoprotein subunit